MAQFRPIMIKSKDSLSNIEKIEGQYIIVTTTNELYLDKKIKNSDNQDIVVREKVSQNVYIQATAPDGVKENDLWFVTEADIESVPSEDEIVAQDNPDVQVEE